MVEWNEEYFLTVPTFILAIFSLIGSCYVCISAYCLRKYKGRSGPFIITHCVFWMSACDIFINIWILLVWIPPIFKFSNRWTNFQCSIIGTFGQFFLVAAVCWYCVIMYCLWLLISSSNRSLYRSFNDNFDAMINLSDYDDFSNTMYYSSPFTRSSTKNITNNNNKKKRRSKQTSSIIAKYNNWRQPSTFMSRKRETLSQHLRRGANIGAILTVIISCVLTGIPWIDKSYGYVENVDPNKANKFECWIENSNWQLTLYLPILIYMIVAIIVLVVCIIRLNKVNSNVKSNQDFRKTKKGLLIQRLIIFLIIFWLTWTVPLTIRIWYFFTHDYAPFVLVALHHASLGFIGLGNSIVWITSTSFQSFTKSLKFRKLKGNPMNAESAHALQEGAEDRVGRFLTFSDNKDDSGAPGGGTSNKLTTPLETPTFSNITSNPSLRGNLNYSYNDNKLSPNYRPLNQSLNENSLVSYTLTNNKKNNRNGKHGHSLKSQRKGSTGQAYTGGIGGQGGALAPSRGNKRAMIARKNSKRSDGFTLSRSVELTPSNTQKSLTHELGSKNFSIYDSSQTPNKGVTGLEQQKSSGNSSFVNVNNSNGLNNSGVNNIIINNSNVNNNNRMVGYRPPQLDNTTPHSTSNQTTNFDSNENETISRTTTDHTQTGDKPTLTPPISFLQNRDSFSNTATTIGTIDHMNINSSGTATALAIGNSRYYNNIDNNGKGSIVSNKSNSSNSNNNNNNNFANASGLNSSKINPAMYHNYQLLRSQAQQQQQHHGKNTGLGVMGGNKAKHTNSYHQSNQSNQSGQSYESNNSYLDDRNPFADDDEESISLTEQSSLRSSQLVD